jgi:hypothetical protein
VVAVEVRRGVGGGEQRLGRRAAGLRLRHWGRWLVVVVPGGDFSLACKGGGGEEMG